MNRIETAAWVRRLILTRPDRSPKMETGKIVIRCPNPSHKGGMERTPSLFINVEIGNNARGAVGSFKCFGCGWSGGWNTLAEVLKLPQMQGKTVGDGVHHAYSLLPEAHTLVVTNDEQEDQESVPWPASKPWRNIRGDLCAALGGRMHLRDEELKLIFPVRMFGETVGTISCALQKVEGEKSYVNSSGNWAHRSLFPYDHVRKMIARRPPGRRAVLVVEGPRDAPTLIQAGIPALATIGSYTAWTEEKARLILDLEADIIVSAFDGDKIGRMARRLAERSFKDRARHYALDFAEGEDPADMGDDQIEWLKGQLDRWLAAARKERLGR